jgi:hypothetical protein
MAMPTQMDQPASSGAKSACQEVGSLPHVGDDNLIRADAHGYHNDGEEDVCKADGGDERRGRLAQQQLLAVDRCCQHGLKRSLVALAHDRIGGDRRRDDDRRNE